MDAAPDSLEFVFDGWIGYRNSIINAVAPLSSEQLNWRPAAHLRSVGELVHHIALGPVAWFLWMDAPGSRELARRIEAWEQDPYGNRYVIEDAISITDQAAELVQWLEASREMIAQTLKTWTVANLKQTYRHVWRGDAYQISRQWTLWRMHAHDLHHGGELAVMLGMQGIKIFELGDLGGHVIEPPRAEKA